MSKPPQRPVLRAVKIPQSPADLIPGCHITMSPGQWDTMLSEAYKLGWTLLEISIVDGAEVCTAAFRKERDVEGQISLNE